MSVNLSFRFVGDATPAPRTVQITQKQGQTLIDNFVRTTTTWKDDSLDDMQYALYRVPLSNKSCMDYSGGNVQCSPASECALPEIYWYNKFNTNDWVQQGGITLNGWGMLQEKMLMPAGNYIIVAGARVKFGGVGLASVLGPTCLQLPSGKNIVIALADDVLIPSPYSTDSNKILDARGGLPCGGHRGRPSHQ